MGCDIHLQFEILRNGVWTWPLAGLPRYLDPAKFLPRPLASLTERSYRTFTLLAGVRDGGEGIEPIAQPRGLPDDLSPELRSACEAMSEDDTESSWWWFGDHSHSWLTLAEILEYGKQWLPDKATPHEVARRAASVLAGRGDCGLETLLDRDAIELLRDGVWGVSGRYGGPVEPEDLRLVFGFDS